MQYLNLFVQTCRGFLFLCRLFRGTPASVATEFAFVHGSPAGHANYGHVFAVAWHTSPDMDWNQRYHRHQCAAMWLKRGLRVELTGFAGCPPVAFAQRQWQPCTQTQMICGTIGCHRWRRSCRHPSCIPHGSGSNLLT